MAPQLFYKKKTRFKRRPNDERRAFIHYLIKILLLYVFKCVKISVDASLPNKMKIWF